jgi:hypothetical protein
VIVEIDLILVEDKTRELLTFVERSPKGVDALGGGD